MTRFTARLEVLPDAQRRVLASLAAAAELGFVLYGGTAVALRLGHRHSVDFDFFTEAAIDRNALGRAFPFLARSQVLQDQADTLCVLVPDLIDDMAWVKLSFFGGIGFGRVGQPHWMEHGPLLVASLDDLMATKLKVLLQRVEAKDYLDIAAMVSAGVDLARGLASARTLFGSSFQPSEALKALVYFEGGDLDILGAGERATLVRAVSSVRDLPVVRLLASTLSLARPGQDGVAGPRG